MKSEVLFSRLNQRKKGAIVHSKIHVSVGFEDEVPSKIEMEPQSFIVIARVGGTDKNPKISVMNGGDMRGLLSIFDVQDELMEKNRRDALENIDQQLKNLGEK